MLTDHQRAPTPLVPGSFADLSALLTDHQWANTPLVPGLLTWPALLNDHQQAPTPQVLGPVADWPSRAERQPTELNPWPLAHLLTGQPGGTTTLVDNPPTTNH